MTLPDDDNLDSSHTKSFLGHMEDLRGTLLWSTASVAIGVLLAIPLTPWILKVLKAPLYKINLGANTTPDDFLKIMQVSGGLTVAMRIIMWTGIMVAIPGVVLAIGNFVFPGLTKKEKKYIVCAALFASVLFAGGVTMGYFMTLPVALKMMFKINIWLGITSDFVMLSDYISFVMKLLIAFGCAFELPMFVLALGVAGIVRSTQLREKRSYVIVGLMVAAMLLTPPDPITLLLMAVPMILLYEACIWLTWLKERSLDKDDDE